MDQAPRAASRSYLFYLINGLRAYPGAPLYRLAFAGIIAPSKPPPTNWGYNNNGNKI